MLQHPYRGNKEQALSGHGQHRGAPCDAHCLQHHVGQAGKGKQGDEGALQTQRQRTDFLYLRVSCQKQADDLRRQCDGRGAYQHQHAEAEPDAEPERPTDPLRARVRTALRRS